MTAISNFTQAMKELTGFDDDTSKRLTKQEVQPEPEPEPEAVVEKETYESHSREQVSPVYRREEEERELHRSVSKEEVGGGSVITSTMQINGNVESSDPIKIDIGGKVNGNMRTTSGVVVGGTVVGDLDADSISIGGSIKGNLSVVSTTRVMESAVIVGNIVSGNMVADGKVKGNVTAAEATEIGSTAIIAGDIVTGDLRSERGCVIHGNVITRDSGNIDFDEDRLFHIGE